MRTFCLTLISTILLSTACIAQPSEQPASGAVSRAGGQPDFFSVGAAVGLGTPEFEGAGFQLNPFPFAAFKWGKLYSDQTGVGYQLYRKGKFRVSALARFAVQDLNRNNVDALDDMESLNLPVYAGISIDLPIDTFLLTTSIQREIGLASEGWRATASLGRPFMVNRQFFLTPSVGVEWNDARGTNYLYEVTASEARPNRPVYEASDSFKLSGSVTGLYRLNDKFTIVGSSGVTWHDDEIFNSPIVDKRAIFSTFLAIGYSF